MDYDYVGHNLQRGGGKKKTLTRHLSRWLSAGGSSRTAAATPAGWQSGHVWHEHRRRKNNTHESIGKSYRSLETFWLPRRCNHCIDIVNVAASLRLNEVVTLWYGMHFLLGSVVHFFQAVRHSYTSRSFICVLKIYIYIAYVLCVCVCACEDIKQDDFSYSDMSPEVQNLLVGNNRRVVFNSYWLCMSWAPYTCASQPFLKHFNFNPFVQNMLKRSTFKP